MTTTILQLQSMTTQQVVALAESIVKQCHDKAKISKRLGGSDEFFQVVCRLLVEFKLGARELRGRLSIELAVCGIARGQARRNWMSYQMQECDTEEVADDDVVGDDEEEVDHGHSLDDVPGLSVLDKLLILHDARRSDQTSDIAKFFGVSTRAVRLRKEKLHARLITRFNLPQDFFEEKAARKLQHLNLTKKVEEKDPLANFSPLVFLGRHTFWIH